MNKRSLAITASSAGGLLIILSAAVIFSRYADFYARKYFIDKSAIMRSQPLQPGYTFDFIRKSELLGILTNGKETLLYSNITLEGASGMFILQLDKDNSVGKAVALQTQNSNSLFNLYHRRLVEQKRSSLIFDGFIDTLWKQHLTIFKRLVHEHKEGVE